MRRLGAWIVLHRVQQTQVNGDSALDVAAAGSRATPSGADSKELTGGSESPDSGGYLVCGPRLHETCRSKLRAIVKVRLEANCVLGVVGNDDLGLQPSCPEGLCLWTGHDGSTRRGLLDEEDEPSIDGACRREASVSECPSVSEKWLFMTLYDMENGGFLMQADYLCLWGPVGRAMMGWTISL